MQQIDYSKLRNDDDLYIKLREIYSPSEDEVIELNKFLLNNNKNAVIKEVVDVEYTRVNNSFIKLCTKDVDESGNVKQNFSWNFRYFRKNRSKFIFLYDAISLIEDYEANSFSFRKYCDKDPNIYHHLAVAYADIKHDSNKLEKALNEFIVRSPDVKGENIEHLLRDLLYLFILPTFFGFADFITCYVRKGMLKEASICNRVIADCLHSDEEARKVYYGFSDLLLGDYAKARVLIKDGIGYWNKNYGQNGKDRKLYPGKTLNEWDFNYYWALGMENWVNDDIDAATNAFESAKKFSGEAVAGRYLMDHFLNAINSGKAIIHIDKQLSLYMGYKDRAYKEKKRLDEKKKYIASQKQKLTDQISDRIDELAREWEVDSKKQVSPSAVEVEGKLEYEIWQTGDSANNAASLKQINEIKKDKKIDLLLDGSDRLHIRGRDVTDFFKRKSSSFVCLKYLIHQKGHVQEIDFIDHLEIEDQPIQRKIRYINSLLREFGLDDLFYVLWDRINIQADAKIAYIKKLNL